MAIQAAFENARDTLFSTFEDVAFPITLEQLTASTFDTTTGRVSKTTQQLNTRAFITRRTTNRDELLIDTFVFLVNNQDLTSLFGNGDTISFNNSVFTIINVEDNSYTTTFTTVMEGAS